MSHVIERTLVEAPPAPVAARRASSPTRSLAWPATVVASALGGTYFVVIVWLAFMRHDTFNTGRFDLEIYTQVVWNSGHGRPFQTTLLKTNLVHLAEHVAPILVPLGWLYRLVPDPKLLLAIQQLALALVGWPIYWWARRALGSDRQALVVLSCFYVGPSLAGIALDDFHAVALSALPLAVGGALVLGGRPRRGAAVALLALLVEEQSALFLLGLGALLVVRRERMLGLLVGGIAAIWLAAAVLVVMPRFHDPRTLESVDGNRTLNHFAELRQDPGSLVGRLLGQRGLDVAVWAIVPTAALGVLAPQTLVLAAPSFATLMLQNRDDTFGRHWAAPLLVAFWLATIAGLARLPGRGAGPRPLLGRARQAGLGLLVLGTVVAFRLVSPLPGGGNFDPATLRFDDHTELLDRAVDRIPSTGSVVASPNVVAHLANRPEAYVFPIDSHYAEQLGWRRKRPDFYVLDLADDLTNRATASQRLNPLNADRPFHVWSAGPKVLILSNQVDAPTIALDARFGDRLLLKGYDLERTASGARLLLHWERYGELRGRYDRDLAVLDARGNRLLYQEDMPLSAQYGSNKWRFGQTILDEVALPPSAGPVTVRVAWVAQEKRKPFALQDGAEAFEFVVAP